REFGERHGRSILRIPDAVMNAMIAYRWPGNVRELQNFVERSVILSRGSELCAPIDQLIDTGSGGAGGATLDDASRAHLMSTLQETNWVVGGRNGAAARLGVNRTTLLSKMRRLGISRETAFA